MNKENKSVEMANLRIYFSDYFGVEERALERYGALNISLVSDMPVFIDPFLLYASDNPEYVEQHDLIVRYLGFLFDYCEANPHLSRHMLETYFKFPEVRNLFLGFCARGNRGRGLGARFALALQSNLRTVLYGENGEMVSETSHLEKLCVIAEGVGRDLVSDFTANIIKDFLLRYTEKFAEKYLSDEKCKWFTVRKAIFDFEKRCWRPKSYRLPSMNGECVILAPKDILTRDETWICRTGLLEDLQSLPESIGDSALKEKLIELLAMINDKRRKLTAAQKTALKQSFVRDNPKIVDWYIRGREMRKPDAIQASRIGMSEVVGLNVFKTRNLCLALFERGFFDHGITSLDAARLRAQIFKEYIEKNDGYQMFISSGGGRISEKQVQSAFGMLWVLSVKMADRESNRGRGPVDFTISEGSGDVCLVEMKMASNSKLEQNLANQLDVYKDANHMDHGVTIIIYTDDKEKGKIDRILTKLELKEGPDLVLVDARRKVSASNVKTSSK